jgi:hypothetical protein
VSARRQLWLLAYASLFLPEENLRPSISSTSTFLVRTAVAPILHLRRVDGADLFETYAKSFRRIWAESYPYELSDERLTAERPAPSRP